MKKMLLTIAALMGLSSAAFAGHFTDILPPASASGCTPVSNGYDYNCTTDSGAPVLTSRSPVILGPKSIAQINALAPSSANQLVTCTNCTNTWLCVSTGTNAGAWVLAVATGPFTAASYPHCQ